MPSIYQLKPAFQNLLRPLARGLYRLGVTANQITLLALFISLGLALFLYIYTLNHPVSWLLLLFPVWMLIRMAFNALDGMLAREFNQQSKLGAFYNELSDVISDSALYLCFMAFPFINNELLLLVTFLAILTEYTGVMAPVVGADRCYDGPMGKSDRAFYFSVLALIIVISPYLSQELNILSYLCNGLLVVITVLLGLTVFNRIKKSLQTTMI